MGTVPEERGGADAEAVEAISVVGKQEDPAGRASTSMDEDAEAICDAPATVGKAAFCSTAEDVSKLLVPAVAEEEAAPEAAAAAAVGWSATSDGAAEAHTVQPKYLKGQGPNGQKY